MTCLHLLGCFWIDFCSWPIIATTASETPSWPGPVFRIGYQIYLYLKYIYIYLPVNSPTCHVLSKFVSSFCRSQALELQIRLHTQAKEKDEKASLPKKYTTDRESSLNTLWKTTSWMILGCSQFDMWYLTKLLVFQMYQTICLCKARFFSSICF